MSPKPTLPHVVRNSNTTITDANSVLLASDCAKAGAIKWCNKSQIANGEIISSGTRYALEVFQGLLDVTQVQQVAGFGGHRIEGIAARVALGGKAYGTYAPGQDGQGQGAAFEVLRLRQDARSDVAACNNLVLHPLEDEVDALRPQAAIEGRVIAVRAGGGTQCPGPFARSSAFVGAGRFEIELANHEARGFAREQPGGFCRRRRRQAHIRRALLLLTQQAVPLFSAALLLFGAGERGRLGHGMPGQGHNQTESQTGAQAPYTACWAGCLCC